MMSEHVTVTVHDPNRPNAGGNVGAARPKPDAPQSTVIGALSINPDYFRTIPGILKIVQLILGIICMALGSLSGWFTFVAIVTFIMTLIWSIAYFFSIREALRLPINWILTELMNTGVYTIFYFTAFVLQLAYAVWARHVVAGIFGLFNTLAYAAGTYFLYIEHKNSQE